jgi:DNA-binding GntR family transcriptional regulator
MKKQSSSQTVGALAKLEPFQRGETLGVRVREQLQHAIMAGLFRPGEKLTLRAVAASLGVSLTPAREALFNLASEGVLELGANGSIYIPKLDEDKAIELIKIRVALESMAAREATHKLDATKLLDISGFNDQLIEANEKKDFRRVIDLNWSFHFSIYSASEMPMLVRLIETCWLRTGSYINLIYPDFAKTDSGILNHIGIIRSIREGDADAVAAAVGHDIEFSSKALLAVLKADGG